LCIFSVSDYDISLILISYKDIHFYVVNKRVLDALVMITFVCQICTVQCETCKVPVLSTLTFSGSINERRLGTNDSDGWQRGQTI